MAERNFDKFIYLQWYPGLAPDYLKAMIDEGVKAFIIEGYHSGTLPTRTEEFPDGGSGNIVPFLGHSRSRKVPVFLTFRPSVTDPDNSYGYAPFDDEDALGYETSVKILRAGIVPLKANSYQFKEVTQRMREILAQTDDYQTIIELMYESFPFRVPLERMQSKTPGARLSVDEPS